MTERERSAMVDLEHWARQYIMAIERQFGPQPKWGTGIVGNLRAACDEARKLIEQPATSAYHDVDEFYKE